ncbi:MAG: hypothetical protein FWG75_01210 [Cystobacterineae bacterium]|nr:hypothetical protein [Cystobacterineae bacterium]
MDIKINLNNKQFKSTSNSENGEVSSDTVFYYKQNGGIISATYQGGSILQGQIIGKIFEDNHLEFAYQHINKNDEIMTGKCISYPKLNEDKKIIIEEYWEWTCRDKSKGQSTLIETGLV